MAYFLLTLTTLSSLFSLFLKISISLKPVLTLSICDCLLDSSAAYHYFRSKDLEVENHSSVFNLSPGSEISRNYNDSKGIYILDLPIQVSLTSRFSSVHGARVGNGDSVPVGQVPNFLCISPPLLKSHRQCSTNFVSLVRSIGIHRGRGFSRS